MSLVWDLISKDDAITNMRTKSLFSEGHQVKIEKEQKGCLLQLSSSIFVENRYPKASQDWCTI